MEISGQIWRRGQLALHECSLVTKILEPADLIDDRLSIDRQVLLLPPDVVTHVSWRLRMRTTRLPGSGPLEH
jgi:hypothetical protein